MRRIISFILVLSLCLSLFGFASSASGIEENDGISINNGAENEQTSGFTADIDAKSAILMDAETGAVLYAKNENEALPPASVTKIMTLLLVAEALADERIKLDDAVTVSANAASMGGSQIFIKEGEEFTVEELLKSTIIASANDAAVALAELISGSEAVFVAEMNERANELGLKNTSFENTTGLDDTVSNHVTSAYDIALMSRELLKHDCITKYSNVWQDSIRDGEFVLTNTNRLVRYYKGCTGLKTGSTDKAGFCVSATAERDGLHLIAVIMGSPSRDLRNEAARALLDYGFSTYYMYKDIGCELESVPVLRGTIADTTVLSKDFTALIAKENQKKVEKKYEIPELLNAPIKAGDKIGEIIYYIDENELGRTDIYVNEDIIEISFLDIILNIITSIILGE